MFAAISAEDSLWVRGRGRGRGRGMLITRGNNKSRSTSAVRGWCKGKSRSNIGIVL
jgi:hypothetical protein